MSEHKEIYAALVKAQTSAQAVYKASKNDFHHYRYASAEDMIEESRDALHSAGLAVIVMGWSCSWRLSESAHARGGMKVRYRLVHTSGESIDFDCETTAITDKGRPEDKAEATALTYSLGYFLRGLLCLPRSDERASSVDARDDRDYVPRGRPERVTLPDASQQESRLAHELLASTLVTGLGTIVNRFQLAGWKKKHEKEIVGLPADLKERIFDAGLETAKRVAETGAPGAQE